MPNNPQHVKKVTDEEILAAWEKYGGDRVQAGEALGISPKTFGNRMAKIKQRPPEIKRPSTYTPSGDSRRFFISCVVSGAPINPKAWKTVQTLCTNLEMEQIYIPVQYDWQDVKSGKETPSYPQQVRQFLLSNDVPLNDHLNVMGSVPIHATIQNPLSGLVHTSNQKSAIYGHPQRAMQSVASNKYKLPKLLYTTGCLTEPRYTTSKAGRKAQDLHCLGGLIVELRGDGLFHVYEVTLNEEYGLYHKMEYYKGNKVSKIDSVPAVYMADEHAEGYDDHVARATYYDPDSIVNTLNPDYVIRGDVYNHGSDSHHGRGNVLERVVRHHHGMNSVRIELDQCFEHIRNTTVGGYKNVIVASNHHEHLKRWLNEFDPHRGDPVNVLLYHELNAAMIRETIETGESIDPFEMYGRLYHSDVYSDCIFLNTDSEFFIKGVDCSSHGHLGPNGSRGSAKNISVLGVPTIIGHGHSPIIYRNVHQVGVGASELGYNKGPSGWMATHCVIYPDGNRSFLHIIEGEW